MSDSDSGSDFEPEKDTKKIESSEEEASEPEVKPKKSEKRDKKDAEKSKKSKAKKRKVESESEEEEDDSDKEEEKTPPPKKGKKSKKDDDKSEIPGSIDLGFNRFVTSNEFKGKKYVHIREYFRGNNGTLAPSKKGISFTTDQLKALIDKVPEIKEKFL